MSTSGRRRLCAGILAAASILPRCGGTPSSTVPPARHGGTLVIGLTADIDSWNPYTAQEAASAGVLDLLYPRLVLEKSVDGRSAFEPWLARSWEFSDDRLNLTFHLREAARWSDGSPVTCEDVRFTHRAQIADELAWSGAFLKTRIVGIDCPDPRTAVFHFSEAYAEQLLDANDDAIVPAAYGAVPFAEWPATVWEQRMRTCGPFRLVSVVRSQEATLERDPNWWDAERTHLDRVVLRIHADDAGAMQRLLDGDVDLVLKVPPLRAAEAAARADLRIVPLPSLSYTFLGWNTLAPGAYARDRRARRCGEPAGCKDREDDLSRLRRERAHPILADPAVRRALTQAIDRRDIVEGLWAGHARVGSSPIVSPVWAHDPGASLEFDPAAAAAALERAGWRDADGDGLRDRGSARMEIRAIVSADNQLRRDVLERVAASLARVGVRLVVEPLPRAEFVARARDKDFDAVCLGWWAGTRIEPQNLLHRRAALDRGNNFVSWSTDESDALMDRAGQAATRELALPLWREWQQLFRDEQPLTILYEEQRLLGLRAAVQAPEPNFLNPFQNLHEWSIRPESP